MSKTTRRDRKHNSTQPIEYELAFMGGFDFVEGGPRAELTSSLLDGVMHPSGSVRVLIVTRPAGPKGSAGFVLDSFQVESMAEYLRSQDTVRRGIQNELIRDRAAHPSRKRLRSEDGVWKEAKVLFLELSPRSVPHPDGLATLKKVMPTLPIEKILAHSDKPSTRSSFTVVVGVEWDDEHWRRAMFRDGALDGVAWE